MTLKWKKTSKGKEVKINGITWSVEKNGWLYCIFKNNILCKSEDYGMNTTFPLESQAMYLAEKLSRR